MKSAIKWIALLLIIEDAETRKIFESVTGIKLDSNKDIAYVQLAAFNRGMSAVKSNKKLQFDADMVAEINAAAAEGMSIAEIAEKLGVNESEAETGEELFYKVIGDLDRVTEAYRGTKNAENAERREDYFLLISTHKDSDGNTINVPVFVNSTGTYNNVFIDVNKVATVFGRNQFKEYISREIKKEPRTR